MELTETTLKEDYRFHGKIIHLKVDTVRLPSGNEATREVVEHNGGVCVLPITDAGEVILVRQFRYPYKEVLTEIPAGKLELGEDPFLAGKRELLEETGAVAENYTFLGKLYPTPGYCGEVIHMYMATGLSFGESCPDEDEFLNVIRMPLSEAVEKVLSGEIRDSKTQVALLKAKLLLKGRTY